MKVRIWKAVAFPLIIGGSIGIIYSLVIMDPLRVLVSEIIVLLLGLLIVLFNKEKRHLAFFITGLFIGLKFIIEVMLIYPAIEFYVLADLLALGCMLSIGLWLSKRKN